MYEELIEELRTTERICRDRMDGEVMLRAAEAGGTHWTGERYIQEEIVLDEKKVRWRKEVDL